MTNTYLKITKCFIILFMLLSFNVFIQHANCSRILKSSFVDDQDHDQNHDINMWLQEKANLFLQVLNNRPSPTSKPNPSCNTPVC